METDLNRDCFTKHGLHMNSTGKEQIMENLANVIESTTVINSGPKIELQWREHILIVETLDINQIQQLGGVNQVPKHVEGEVAKPQPKKDIEKTQP
jgi:hypothetical protein